MTKEIRPPRFELRFQSRAEAIILLVVIVLLLGLAGVAALYGAGWLILYGLKGAFLPPSMHLVLRVVLGSLLVWVPERLLYIIGRQLLSITWATVKLARTLFEALRHD